MLTPEEKIRLQELKAEFEPQENSPIQSQGAVSPQNAPTLAPDEEMVQEDIGGVRSNVIQ